MLITCAACLAGSPVQAAIPLNAVQTFNAVPPAEDWAMLSVAGGAVTPNSVATLDAFVQTNTASIITNGLVAAAGNPAATGGNVMWSSTRSNVISRPNAIAYTLLLARVQNTSGGTLASVNISYDLIVEASVPEESLAHAVYYSLTGEPSSWQPIAALSAGTDNTAGTYSKITWLNLGSWTNGAILYLLWADDNGSGSPDTALAIDNFLATTSIACPSIITQPANLTSLANRTVTLSVGSTGPGMVYRWSKVDSGALSDGPTGSGSTISGATAFSLIISNAQPTDTGDYVVVVSNSCSGVPVTSAIAHLQINPDTQPPRFVLARAGTDSHSFVVTVDEVLCTDPSCGYDGGTYLYVWTVVNINDPSQDLMVTNVVISPEGTNVILTTSIPRTPEEQYRISVWNSGPGFQVSDLAGNAMAEGTYIWTMPSVSFMQNVDGYTGVEDTELELGFEFGGPDVSHGAAPSILVDQDNRGAPSHGLLRFNNAFGSGAGQIPLGCAIISATLTLQSTAAGSTGDDVLVYRMLVPWSQSSATWNSMVNGLTNDDVEMRSTPDLTIVSKTNTVPFTLEIDCEASIQAWANGEPNYGWGMLPTGTDGYRFDASAIASGPKLTVVYYPCVENFPPTIVTQPPASTAAIEGSTVIINVTVQTMGNTTYQWKKDGVNVPGQTNQTLYIVNVSPLDTGSYTLRVTNPSGSVETSVAFLFVTDTGHSTRPTLTHAVSASSTTIVLAFDKPLAATATNISHYTLSGGAAVSEAGLSNGLNNATVTLTTSERSATTTLTITGVTDTRASPNLINPNPTVVVITLVNVADGVEWNGSWDYNTNNLDGTPSWKNPGFVLGADWLTGNALFGTERDVSTVAGLPVAIATVIPPNTNTPPDFVTAYFRKSVTLPALAGGTSYVLEHVIDDGAVFYWDGVEFGRYNMTNGTVIHSTKAAAVVEASAQSIALPASANAGGTHLLAVELHQGGATTSTDLLFGAQIVAVSGPAPSLNISHSGITNVVTWTADSHWRLVRSAVVTGPYTTVAGNPFLIFRLPLAVITNNAFFKLQFNPNP